MAERDLSEENPRPDPARAMLHDFAKRARLALVFSIALAAALLTAGILAAMSLHGPRCAGRQIAGLPLADPVGLAIVFGLIISVIAWLARGRDERLRKLFATIESPSGDIDPFVGRTVANATLAMAVAMLGFLAVFVTATSYYPVLALCFPSWWAGS
jgi:hypothetical protein